MVWITALFLYISTTGLPQFTAYAADVYQQYTCELGITDIFTDPASTLQLGSFTCGLLPTATPLPTELPTPTRTPTPIVLPSGTLTPRPSAPTINPSILPTYAPPTPTPPGVFVPCQDRGPDKCYCIDDSGKFSDGTLKPGNEPCDDASLIDVAKGDGGVTGPCGTVISWDQQIMESLQQGTGSWNHMSGTFSGCGYTAVPSTSYLSTFNVIDAYNLAGLHELSQAAHTSGVDMLSWWRSAPAAAAGYYFIDYNGSIRTIIGGIMPGQSVFLGTHVGIVNSVEVDANGNGWISMLHTNTPYWLGVLVVANWQLVNTPSNYTLVGFGGYQAPNGGIPTATPIVQVTLSPTPLTTPPPVAGAGTVISAAELSALPMSGSSWNTIVSDANSSWGSANLADNNSSHDVLTLAGALVAARTGDSAMRQKTIAGLQSATSSSLARALELSRGLQTYIIAADIINYHDPAFEQWVRTMLTTNVQGHSCPGVMGTAECAPNNWGGHARASVAAAAIYLNDQSLKDKIVAAHREFIGLGGNKMVYQSTNWHADPANKAGVNRIGTTISGTHVSGVLPEDWRRGAEYQWTPTVSGYMWEGMQGFVVTAVILHRAGLVPFNAGDNAVVRAMDMLYGRGEAATNNPVFNNPPAGDDTWIPWVVNHFAGTAYPTAPARSGKNFGYTDWLYQ